MALSNIQTRLMRRDYSSLDDFYEDVRLIFVNCRLYRKDFPDDVEVCKQLQIFVFLNDCCRYNLNTYLVGLGGNSMHDSFTRDGGYFTDAR